MDRELSKTSRCHALDWLRVLALLSVFFLHSLRFFDFMPWHVKNADQSELITQMVLFRVTWGMPLLFLVAGAASAFAARRRTPSQLLVARFRRLGVPFLFGALFLIPPQRWIEARHHFAFDGSFLEFLGFSPSALPSSWPGRELLSAELGFSPLWFGYLGHHLWFLGFLLLYGVFATPVLSLLSARGRWLVESLARLATKPGGLLFFLVPIFLVQVAWVPDYPRYLDWADCCRYLVFFSLGYLWTLDRRFFEAAQRDVWVYWVLGLSGLAFQLWAALDADLMRGFMAAPGSAPGWPAYQLWIAVASFVWPVFFLGLVLRYLNFPSRRLDYLNEAALPFYALHQTVILAVGVLVVELDLPILTKLSMIVVTSLAIIAVLYELGIRRASLPRFFFGMKARSEGRREGLEKRVRQTWPRSMRYRWRQPSKGPRECKR